MSNHNRNYSQAYNNKRSLLDIIHKNDPIKIKIIKPRDDWNSKNFSDYTNNINPFNIANVKNSFNDKLLKNLHFNFLIKLILYYLIAI